MLCFFMMNESSLGAFIFTLIASIFNAFMFGFTVSNQMFLP